MEYFATPASRWITLGNFESAVYFRKEFTCSAPKGATCVICAGGVYELYINGKKVGDHEFDPAISVYDRHVRYVKYDVSSYLKTGRNAIGVILGNGEYNCPYPAPGTAWGFADANWRASVRFRLELYDAKEKLILGSGTDWKSTGDGPITYNNYRAGETYDARKELGAWSSVNYDESAWWPAILCKSPGGLIEEQTAPPVKVIDVIPMTGPNNSLVYDAGVNIAGRVRITCRGNAGSQVRISTSEQLFPNGTMTLGTLNNNPCNKPRFQTDIYYLKGSGTEVWESRFGYNGFRYAEINHPADVKILKVEAVQLSTAFETVGSFRSSIAQLNKLQEITLRSFRSNFVGIPTDCPHREKNGWTGDAQLASDTGLYNFDTASAYNMWMTTMRDCQRPNGDLPGIVPSSSSTWFNWGDGPAWDCAFFVIPWNVYLFTGDSSALEANYDGMKRWIQLEEEMSVDFVPQFGLGDWAPPNGLEVVDPSLVITGCYSECVSIALKTAKLLGKKDDAKRYEALLKNIRAGFNRTYYNGNGIYDNGGLTAQSTPLYFGLCDPKEEKKVVARLVAKAKAEKFHAQFGILGAKYVPRVLAEYGYADLALEFFLQDEYPSWGHWLKLGATTLWEHWDGASSQNHIMYGDLSAWFYKYIGGFRSEESAPGYRQLTVKPEALKKLKSAEVTYRGYISETKFDGKTFSIRLTVPADCKAKLILPDGSETECLPGITEKTCRVKRK